MAASRDGAAGAAASSEHCVGTDELTVREWCRPMSIGGDASRARTGATVGDIAERALSDNTFTVMQFNMLADSLHDGFPHVPDQSVLAWEWRGPRLLREIARVDPDILCAEEVDDEHYTDYFLPALAREGYAGEFVRRQGSDRVHGVCIFWRRSTFRKLECVRVALGDGHVGLVVGLLHETTSNVVIVAAAHLKAKPGYENRRLREGVRLVAAAREEARSLCDSTNDTPYFVVCGDFNDEPNSPVCKYFATGTTMYRHDGDTGPDARSDIAKLPHEFRHMRYSCPVVHDLGLTSAYTHYALRGDDDGNCPGTHEPYTTFKKREHEVIHCIDYIWLPSGLDDADARYGGHLHVRALLEIPPRTALPHRLPSKTYPSDHLAIAAKISFA